MKCLCKKLVAGDLIGKILGLGIPHTYIRTRHNVANIGNIHTFRGLGYVGTFPCFTFSSEGIFTFTRKWRVIKDFTCSGHHYIGYNIDENVKPRIYKKESPMTLKRSYCGNIFGNYSAGNRKRPGLFWKKSYGTYNGCHNKS